MKVPNDIPERTWGVWQALANAGPLTKHQIAERLDLSPHTVREYIGDIRASGYNVPVDGKYRYHLGGFKDPDMIADETPPVSGEDRGADGESDDTETDDRAGESVPNLGLDSIEREADEPDESDLTGREEFIARELQTGASVDELAEEMDERPSVVTQHIRDLYRQGWQIYIDESAGHVAIEGEHTLRSSEHKGTRTRKANRWWELRHNELVREFKSLDTPDADLAPTAGNEDWVTHITDLHAGDCVRTEEGTIVYETAVISDVIDYITRKSIALSRKHNSSYDTGHLLYGGDFITNESVYEGQFQDLDAWLDEQHDTLVEPLIRQIKAFSEEFETVQVVCQIGNHGDHRASGKSRQANADLILFKTIRNTIAQIRKHSGYAFDNVRFVLGEARPFRNFELRGGRFTGHLRHGQHRKPQAETAARSDEWRGTLLDHEFDVAYMGHYHISGRVPWPGPPIIVSPSPKPADEFVEKLGGRTPKDYKDMATAHGMSDDGITTIYPIDSRDFVDPMNKETLTAAQRSGDVGTGPQPSD